MLDHLNHDVRHYVRQYVRYCALLALLATAPASLATEERWYRVELMVFSHTGGQYAEQWDPTPRLAYPETALFLQTADYVSSAPDSNFQAPATAEGESYPLRDDVALPALPALPTPFVMLDDAEQEFRGKAAYMQRSGRYRMLFHEAWLQPVIEKSRSAHLILDRSGDTGQWPELQGSVLLYLSRYLHLETNLWLNTRGEYLPGSWQMPAPPLGPSSFADEPLDSELDSSNEDNGIITDSYSEAGQEQWQDATAEEEAIEGPVYPFRHAVLLQQKRRMRSSEVHYVDHPMLGVVVKLTPLTTQELEALAGD